MRRVGNNLEKLGQVFARRNKLLDITDEVDSIRSPNPILHILLDAALRRA
jgi:hypothetical protein